MELQWLQNHHHAQKIASIQKNFNLKPIEKEQLKEWFNQIQDIRQLGEIHWESAYRNGFPSPSSLKLQQLLHKARQFDEHIAGFYQGYAQNQPDTEEIY